MARLLARTLTLPRPASVAASRLPSSRALSTNKVEFVEIDLSEESPVSSGGSVGDAAAPVRMRRLEDAIHGVLVRRAAPDWLPFVPGGSYWVPPMSRPLGVADLLGAAVYTSRGGSSVLTEEETMCFTTVRGWPSAKYFVEVCAATNISFLQAVCTFRHCSKLLDLPVGLAKNENFRTR